MLIPNFRSPAVYRLRPTIRTDLYGDSRQDWSDPERVLLRGAVIQSPKTEEADLDGLLEGKRNLYVDGTVDLGAYDRIECDGQVWTIEGTPTFRRGLTGKGFTTARLARAERR